MYELMASGDTVEQIKERLSIVDVVSSYVELHPAGKNLKGKSPFTNEKTPSFYVSPDRGMYYCFSSSPGGDIFTFVEKMEGVDFRGALKILAERAGVDLVPEDPKKKGERDRAFDALEAATVFYTDWLDKKPAAQTYLDERGVKPATIAKWRIGYAPGPPEHGWREVRTHLKEKQFTDTELLKTGLIKQTDGGKEPYDVFRDRVMFPIFDASGRVVGFSGRILSKDSEAPKYVNSPETELFNKSEILFGYDKAKQSIRTMDFSLIVEGQFDVVMSHQAGYTNTVAVSGTALTPHHVGLLQRLSNKVVLALDNDRAGIAAMQRAADLMLARGMDVKVARMEGGKDPADMVVSDLQAFRHTIGQAGHVIEYLLDVLEAESKDERSFKLKAREDILPFVVKIPNLIDQEHFEGVIAERLKTTKDAVHQEVERLRARAAANEERKPVAKASEAETPTATPPDTRERLERQRHELLAYLITLTELTDATIATKLTDVLASITGESIEALRTALPPESLSQQLFSLEETIEKVPKTQLKADIAHAASSLAARTHKLVLMRLRDELGAVEAAGGDTTAVLREIAAVQQRLGSGTYTHEDF